jgi:hypothetical protein
MVTIRLNVIRTFIVTTVVETLHQDATDINQQLKRLIDQFNNLDLDIRLKESTTIFDRLRLFFERHKLTEAKRPLSDSLAQLFEDTHQQTLDIYERLIMLHVEESDYLDRLIQLQESFSVYTGEPYQAYLEQVESTMTPEERETLSHDIKALQSA